MSTKKLSEKVKKFCKEYIIDFNATQAYIRAGYSKNGAKVAAAKLLTFTNIQDHIQKLIKKSDDKGILNRERVLLEIARLAYSNVQNVFTPNGNLLPVQDIDEDTARAISGIKVRRVINYEKSTKNKKVFDDIVEYKFHPKPAVLDMAMKHLGEYNNEFKLDLTGTKIMKIELSDE